MRSELKPIRHLRCIAPPPDRRPRHHVKTSPCGPNQARAVGLPPDALEAAAAQLEQREAVVREA